MWAVIKKEFKSYFYSPIGYVVIGIFLLCFSVFFYLTILFTSNSSVDLGALYYYTALYGLIIIIPIITMRMFAEERKNGTEQLLLTSPTSMFKVVIGKLLSGLSVILITLLMSFIFFFIIMFFGKPNISTTLVAIFGFILISIAEISFGMFASSITENQIIAGIITVAFLLISLFLTDISNIFSGFALINYYTSFAQGVISIENIISLITFSMVFICLTIIVMQRRKLVK
ncbi:MAG: ABC transporter permease subunit [Clostridia bacterium]|nr:ABC transporter permease subunit [Clostridia bacterium]